jgi:hypothetical protein
MLRILFVVGLSLIAFTASSLTAATAETKPYAEGMAPGITEAARAFPSFTAIYLFPGARSSTVMNNQGIQTSVHCMNTSNVTREVRFVARNFDATVLGISTISIPPFANRTYSTALTTIYLEDLVGNLSTTLRQGSIVVQSTGPTVFCNAVIVDAASSVPNGVTLTGVRFNAAPGTME